MRWLDEGQGISVLEVKRTRSGLHGRLDMHGCDAWLTLAQVTLAFFYL